jgi:hypothetical protein
MAVAVGERSVEDEAEDRSSCEIRVHGVAKDHGYAHRWRDNQEGEGRISSLDDVSVANDELATVPFANDALNAILQLSAEALEIYRVDAAVHEAEAVGWTHDGIAGYVEYGSVVDLHAGEFAAKRLPCGR